LLHLSETNENLLKRASCHCVVDYDFIGFHISQGFEQNGQFKLLRLAFRGISRADLIFVIVDGERD